MTIGIIFDKSDLPNLFNLYKNLCDFHSGKRDCLLEKEDWPAEIHKYYTLEQLFLAESFLQNIMREEKIILLIGDGKAKEGEKTPLYDKLLARRPELKLISEMLDNMV